MSNKILCGGCGKVYPLWIAADAKPTNCSECGTQVEQRQVQPQPLVPESSIVTEPVAPVSTNDINFQSIFFNTAIIGTAFLLIVAVIWVGTRMFVSESPTVATNSNTPAHAEPSSNVETTAEGNKAGEPAERTPDKEDPRVTSLPSDGENSPANKTSITDVFDEKSLGRSVGLVKTAMAHTDENLTKYYQFLWIPVPVDEISDIYDEETQEYLEDTFPVIQNKQLIPGGSTGTCFLITSNGFAITNHHVVDDYLAASSQRQVYKELEDRYDDDVSISPKLFVYLDGKHHSAEVVYDSNQYDFAILKIAAISNYPFFRLSSADSVHRLTQVTVLGFPGSSREASNREEYLQDQKNKESGDPRNWFKDSDLVYVATRGEVSKVSERGGDGLIVQHTATIDSGNSGGPLVTNEGVVLGINTWQATRVKADGFVQGVGMNLSLSMHSLFAEIAEQNPDINVLWVDSLPKPND